jgi:hypothetical protein
MAYFLKSVLRQLLDHITHLPKPLVEAFNRLGGSECSLSATVLEKIVLEVMQASSQIYVLIDALDECVDSGRRKAIISFLEQAARSPHVRLLLTSRPHVQEIRSTFDRSYQILVRASEADIRAYVSQEISRARVTDIVDTSFVHRIMDTIIHQAEGMSVRQCSIHASL